ncbi:hypothetical protein LWM68_02335 [Niabella sp. W65]|nr:hypothetical protein [Niabella sp. W65]MCH7361720.1 hypothetical protein [Niabella sp. W65]
MGRPGKTMQIDLQEPMQIEKIAFVGEQIPVSFTREGNVYWLSLQRSLVANTEKKDQDLF